MCTHCYNTKLTKFSFDWIIYYSLSVSAFWQKTNRNILCVCVPFANTGPVNHNARLYFPYVSSESDLQRYKTVPVKQATAAQDARTSSSLSNVPSDSLKAKVPVHFIAQWTWLLPDLPLSMFLFTSKIIYKTQDNGSGKYFQGTRQTINMGEKVAQVRRHDLLCQCVDTVCNVFE